MKDTKHALPPGMVSPVREALSQMEHFLNYVEDMRVYWSKLVPEQDRAITGMIVRKGLQVRKAMHLVWKQVTMHKEDI